MLRDELNREGYDVGRKHARWYVDEAHGIKALSRKPGATGYEVYPCLLRALAIDWANQIWALDTPYALWPRGLSILPPSWIEHRAVY